MSGGEGCLCLLERWYLDTHLIVIALGKETWMRTPVLGRHTPESTCWEEPRATLTRTNFQSTGQAVSHISTSTEDAWDCMRAIMLWNLMWSGCRLVFQSLRCDKCWQLEQNGRHQIQLSVLNPRQDWVISKALLNFLAWANWRRLESNGADSSQLAQTWVNWRRLELTGADLSQLGQTWVNWRRLESTGTDLSQLAQTWVNWWSSRVIDLSQVEQTRGNLNLN